MNPHPHHHATEVLQQPQHPGSGASGGDFAQAERHFRAAIRLDPKLAAARFDYGLALAHRERFAEARPQFEAAARLDPNLAEAHNALGDLAAIEDQVALAVRHYRRAIQLRPDYYDAHLHLAQSLQAAGNGREAAQHFRKAAGSPDPAIREAAQKALTGRDY